MPSPHHRLMPRYKRYFTSGHTVFLTLVTRKCNRWLAAPSAKDHLLQCMRMTKQIYPFRHLAHVILDDHLHWILIPESPNIPGQIVSSLKRNVIHARMRMNRPAQGLWQPHFHDHIIRDSGDFQKHLDYVHYNPVKHGYVDMPVQYRWSSFHAWVDRAVYHADWGAAAPAHLEGMNPE